LKKGENQEKLPPREVKPSNIASFDGGSLLKNINYDAGAAQSTPMGGEKMVPAGEDRES